MIEYSAHLHEHFVHPLVIKNAHYMPPLAPGYSVTMLPKSIATYTFPTGTFWQHE